MRLPSKKTAISNFMARASVLIDKAVFLTHASCLIVPSPLHRFQTAITVYTAAVEIGLHFF